MAKKKKNIGRDIDLLPIVTILFLLTLVLTVVFLPFDVISKEYSFTHHFLTCVKFGSGVSITPVDILFLPYMVVVNLVVNLIGFNCVWVTIGVIVGIPFSSYAWITIIKIIAYSLQYVVARIKN